MYKSHTYNSFIGHAETEIVISENEQLLIKYLPPMLINQPGNIIVSNFESNLQAENLALEKEQKIVLDDTIAKQKQLEQEERSRNGIIIFIIIIVISAIIYGISIASIYDY